MPSSVFGPKVLDIPDGGGVIILPIPEGSRLDYVGVAPDDASVPETSVLVDLQDTKGNWLAQILELGVASSDATFTHAHTRADRILLPDDIDLQLKAQIFNLTGATVKWRLVAILEVKENVITE